MRPEALRIGQRTWERIIGHARDASPEECMGLLGTRPGAPPGLVLAACRLRARASRTDAEVAPLTIARAVAEWLRRGIVSMGLWHSHGRFGVHHSLVDDETTGRLLPGMAEANYRRPHPASLTPRILGPDQAELPLPDGTGLRITVLGAPIPDGGGYHRATWGAVETHFAPGSSRPSATRHPDHLALVGGPVVLRLGLPAGATVMTERIDPAPVRFAHAYSLVVNDRGQAHCVVVSAYDLPGRTLLRRGRCAVQIVMPSGDVRRPGREADPPAAPAPTGGRGGSTGTRGTDRP